MSVSFETWTKVGVILLSLFSGCDLSLLFLSVFKFKPRTLQQKRKKKNKPVQNYSLIMSNVNAFLCRTFF